MSPRLLISLIFITTLSACALDHSKYLKQMDKLNANNYWKIQIGESKNYTALSVRFFDRFGTKELSHENDPKVQAQISNHGSSIYYNDNTRNQILHFIKRPAPIWINTNWDVYAVVEPTDNSSGPNYIAFEGDVDYIANILDKGDLIRYKDSAIDINVQKRPMPSWVHRDFDSYYLTRDETYGMLKSSQGGVYRLFFIDSATKGERKFDFRPAQWGLQASKLGIYRGIGYVPQLKEWVVYDFVPTQKLICFDLARVYERTSQAANTAMSQAILAGIAMALSGYSSAVFSGVAQSTYTGYYSGTVTTNFTGYAETYDYRYLAAATVNVLDAAFSGSAARSQIEDVMRQQSCGFEF